MMRVANLGYEKSVNENKKYAKSRNVLAWKYFIIYSGVEQFSMSNYKKIM